jgi:hypothetical protein
MEETTSPMLSKCNFTEAVWNLVAPKYNLPNFASMYAADGLGHGPVQWLNRLLELGSKKEKKEKAGVLIMFWRMIWK